MRFLARLCVFLALLCPLAVSAQVIVDATSTSAAEAASVTTYNATANITVGASANYLTIWLSWSNIVSAVTVKWNGATGQTMTQIGFASNTTGAVSVGLYGLTAPTSGNLTLNVTWTGGGLDLTVFGVSWTGVNQTTPFSGLQTVSNASLGGGATTGLAAITSATGNAVIAAFANDFSWASPTATNNTQLFDSNQATHASAGNRAAGAASVTMSATNGSTADNYAALGANLNAAAGGGPTCPMTRSMLGVGC